jgi:hypothetical protein
MTLPDSSSYGGTQFEEIRSRSITNSYFPLDRRYFIKYTPDWNLSRILLLQSDSMRTGLPVLRYKPIELTYFAFHLRRIYLRPGVKEKGWQYILFGMSEHQKAKRSLIPVKLVTAQSIIFHSGRTWNCGRGVNVGSYADGAYLQITIISWKRYK